MLALAASVTEPVVDVTWVFYDHEEVESALNGLGRLARNRPELLEADFAILGEPTDGEVEGGCNGTLRAEIRTRGVARALRASLDGRERHPRAGTGARASWRPISRSRSRSTVWSTARASTRSASRAGSPAT